MKSKIGDLAHTEQTLVRLVHAADLKNPGKPMRPRSLVHEYKKAGQISPDSFEVATVQNLIANLNKLEKKRSTFKKDG